MAWRIGVVALALATPAGVLGAYENLLECGVENSEGVYTFYPQKVSWVAAREKCAERKDGSVLATVRTQQDFDEIAALVQANIPLDDPDHDGWTGAWTSLNAIESTGDEASSTPSITNIPANFPTSYDVYDVAYEFAGVAQQTPFWPGVPAYDWFWAETDFQTTGGVVDYDKTWTHRFSGTSADPTYFGTPAEGWWGKVGTGFWGNWPSGASGPDPPRSNFPVTVCGMANGCDKFQTNELRLRGQPDNSGGYQRCGLISRGSVAVSGGDSFFDDQACDPSVLDDNSGHDFTCPGHKDCNYYICERRQCLPSPPPTNPPPVVPIPSPPPTPPPSPPPMTPPPTPPPPTPQTPPPTPASPAPSPPDVVAVVYDPPLPQPPPPPLSPGERWTDEYEVVIEWIFCADEPTLPGPDDTPDPSGARTSVGVDGFADPNDPDAPNGKEPPGSGPGGGGLASWDHDGDPATPPRVVVPGLDSTLTPTPNADGAFDFEPALLPDGIDPDDVTNVAVAQLNPCATATCTTDELTAGKDNFPDLIVTTGAGKPSYTLLNDPNDPGGGFSKTTPIGEPSIRNDDDRDAKLGDVNGDGVPDLVVVSHDAPNKVLYGDPTRPGAFDKTLHDTFGAADDGTVAVELLDLDNDPTTPVDIFVANSGANKADSVYLSHQPVPAGAPTGAGTGVMDSSYTKKDVPGSETSPTTAMALSTGTDSLGASADHAVVVLVSEDGTTQLVELDQDEKTTSVLTDQSAELAAGYVSTLDSTIAPGSASVVGVQVGDVSGDGVDDVVVAYENNHDNSANGVPGHVYVGAKDTPTDAWVAANPTRIDVGAAGSNPADGAIVGLEIVDTNNDGKHDAIEFLDENGGIHHYDVDTSGGVTISAAAKYPDPNSPKTPATEPFDHRSPTRPATADATVVGDAGVLTTGDFDKDGHPDLISGNQLFLSSRATTEGDFSTVAPIQFDHGAVPLVVAAADLDGDGDVDLFVVPGPEGQSGAPATGGQPPYVLLNDGSGVLDDSDPAHKIAKVELPNLVPQGPTSAWWSGSGGGWSAIDQNTVAVDKLPGFDGDTIVLGVGHGGEDAILIRPTVAAGAIATAQDLETMNAAGNLLSVVATSPDKKTKEVVVVDVDGDGVNEIVHVYAFSQVTKLDIVSLNADGTVKETVAVMSSAADQYTNPKMDVGDVNGDSVLDVVVCGGMAPAAPKCKVFFGPDPPIDHGDADAVLADWALANGDRGYQSLNLPEDPTKIVTNVVVGDFDGNGFDDIVYTTLDPSTGATSRKVVEMGASTIESIGLITPANIRDLQFSDEANKAVEMLLKEDVNGDGALDLVYTMDGESHVVLNTLAARTDLDSLATGGAHDLVQQIADQLNPSATPDPAVCATTPADTSCVASTDGAWFDNKDNVQANVADSTTETWGSGQVDVNGATTVVGAPVDPSTIDDGHKTAPCVTGGSQVVPVTTSFSIDFPVVPCVPAGPECILLCACFLCHYSHRPSTLSCTLPRTHSLTIRTSHSRHDAEQGPDRDVWPKRDHGHRARRGQALQLHRQGDSAQD